MVPEPDQLPASSANGPPLTHQIESALWGYVKGQAILSTVIGTSAGVGMYILGVTGLVEGAEEYALLFGLWTAFVEVRPSGFRRPRASFVPLRAANTGFGPPAKSSWTRTSRRNGR